MLNTVVQSGGHQYIVSEGSIIKCSSVNSEVGQIIDLQSLGCFGKERKECDVKAEVLEHGRDKKVIVFKKLRRHNHRKFNTHRQGFTLLKIKSIEVKE